MPVTDDHGVVATYGYAEEDQLHLRLTDYGRSVLEEWEEDSPGRIDSDCAMWEFFESLICNSELDWIEPADTGDLTDAPLLGIYGRHEEPFDPSVHYGRRHVGRFGDPIADQYQPIIARWGWEPYQVRSLLRHLLNHGSAVLTNRW